MAKPCFVHQPCGVGDIIYIQKIIELFRAKGHEVVVPVRPDLRWMQQHLGRPGVSYVDMTAPFAKRDLFAQLVRRSENVTPNQALRGAWKTDQLIFLPLGPCYRWCGEPNVMLSKYWLLDQDGSDWADYVHFSRNREREQQLLQLLDVENSGAFCLVNGHGSTKKLNLSVAGVRNIQLRLIEGFTLFDWAAVVERASAIVTIDTSLVLLVEVLRPRIPLVVISRCDPPEFQIRPIVRLPWRFMPKADGKLVVDHDAE